MNLINGEDGDTEGVKEALMGALIEGLIEELIDRDNVGEDDAEGTAQDITTLSAVTNSLAGIAWHATLKAAPSFGKSLQCITDFKSLSLMKKGLT